MIDTVTRPRLSQLLGLAWPIVVSRSAQVIVGVTDAIMVAPLGEDALAATTTGALNTFAFMALQIGTVFIVGSFVSQLTGKGDSAGARRFGVYGLVIALFSGILSLASLPFLHLLAGPLDLSPHVKELLTDYMRIRLLSVGAAVGLEALASYYSSVKNTVLPMIAQVLAMALNVLFCWLLIRGHFGFPALGVAGSAWAATGATTLAFGFLLVCFALHLGAPKVSFGKLRATELKRTLQFGVPVGLNFFVELASFLVFINFIVAKLGTTELAATMAVMQLNSVAFMPAFALATAGSIFVGQAIGANAKDDVARTVRLTVGATAAWLGLVGLAYTIAPRFWLSPLAPQGGVLFLEVGAGLLVMSVAWQFFDGVAMVYAEALRAAGDTSFSLWARALLGWVVFVPGAWLTTRVYGGRERGAAMWLVAYLGLLAVVMVLRFRSGKWRTMELVEPQLDE